MTRLILFALLILFAAWAIHEADEAIVERQEQHGYDQGEVEKLNRLAGKLGRQSLKERQREAIMDLWQISEEYVRNPSDIYGGRP